MPVWLAVLAVAALVLYTDDYVIAGVLPEIAADLDVTVGTAGRLVTVFSLTLAVAAPLAALVTARCAPRALLAGAAVVFVAANALAAVTPAFEALLAARVLAALAAAAATPTLFGLTARLAPPQRLGRYLAVVGLGVTGAIAVGVPLGTWIGAAWGWRATFGAMALAGLCVAVGVAAAVPPVAATTARPREQLRALATAPVWLGLAGNVVLMSGSMMLLTYLAPFVAGLATADTAARATLFAVSGFAGMAGLWLGGHGTDRWGADRALLIGVGVFVAAMLAFTGLWPLRPVPVALLYPLALLWAGAAFWNSPAVQARLHRLAGPAATPALAANTSGTYLGVAVGATLGGAVVDAAGPGALPPIAAAAGLVALTVFGLAARAARQPLRASAARD
ncbi:MFS transporter [Nocardia farcinica]|uniref:MFS transporter n=1 Tax=Nocardia farcinica TaxID=37329 RepID=UPI002456734A|nr:MFS transporter [Nocardia farcinica]